MTLAAIERTAGPYTSDGVQTAYPYPFRILGAGEIAVYVDDLLASPAYYAVTGVDSDSGGNVVFTQPPQQGSTVWIFGATPGSQLLDYVDGDAFPADSHEEGLDRLVQLYWELREELQRRPGFPKTAPTALRNMLYPPPLPQALLGWDAMGTGLSNYPQSGVLPVPITPESGIVTMQQSISLTPAAGQVQVAVPALYPAGAQILGVTLRVVATLGSSQGLTTMSLGDATLLDRWGSGIARTELTTTTAAHWHSAEYIAFVSTTNGLLTADGGRFDGTGLVTITCHYQTYTPADDAIGLAELPAPVTTISQVPISTVTGLAQRQQSVTLTPTAGAAFATLTGLYPADASILGVTMRVVSTLGSTQGLTTLSLGDASVSDRWGSGIARTSGTVTNPAYWHSPGRFAYSMATDVLLLAEGGAFDGTGVVTVTCHYEVYTPQP